MNVLESRAERGPRHVFFAWWGRERGSPIATSDPAVVSSLKSRAQLCVGFGARSAIARRVLEVLL
jgi:hypothetical protein